MLDPYSYMLNNLSREEENAFLDKERQFYELMLLRSDLLTKQLWREQEYYRYVPSLIPLRIDDHLYYRRIENMADSMTLYRFPVDQLAKWHELADPNFIEKDEGNGKLPTQVNAFTGEVPPYPHDPELNESLNDRQKEEAR